ncbi:ATP-binding protein [Candidatus Haliotispira prima]|uniref:ATP-binding protein n=1 Tax=Candidatus Haliotispira prima TaxID=3034016 RepID=A0ABY8MF11_9SPIO|nr:ATP-binding protein [Candidatus Haliotispira prima]
MSDRQIMFNRATIQKIFGHEAAENKDIENLKRYYFKNDIYERVTEDLPLGILVGHKGVGKSALVTIAKSEDDKQGIVTILVKPDQFSELPDGNDMLGLISIWKRGIMDIIQQRVLENLGAPNAKNSSRFFSITQNDGVKIAMDVLKGCLKKEGKNFDSAIKKYANAIAKNKRINVYFDDMDRAWTGDKVSIMRFSALLNALRDLSTEKKGLNFILALRTDVYHLVRTSDESTDKIESSVIWLKWTNHEILAMLIKRIRLFLNSKQKINDNELVSEVQSNLAEDLKHVMNPIFNGRGLWANIPVHRMLMTLIRRRPRDLVKLCTLAANNAREQGHSRIETTDFDSIFDDYSQSRLQDVINEYKSEITDIEKLLLGMKPTEKERLTSYSTHKKLSCYTNDQLINKIKNICEQGVYRLNSKKMEPSEIIEFLYKIEFITGTKDQGKKIIRHYFETQRFLANGNVDFGFDWEIHPAFRWALNPNKKEDIFNHIKISDGDM